MPDKKMAKDCFLKPAWTHNGSIKTDLPLTIIGKESKEKLAAAIAPGQLLCVGKVYLKTQNGLIRIR